MLKKYPGRRSHQLEAKSWLLSCGYQPKDIPNARNGCPVCKLSLTLRLLARILQAPYEPEKETCLMSVVTTRSRLILAQHEAEDSHPNPWSLQTDLPQLNPSNILASSHLTADQRGRVLSDNQSTGR